MWTTYHGDCTDNELSIAQQVAKRAKAVLLRNRDEKCPLLARTC